MESSEPSRVTFSEIPSSALPFSLIARREDTHEIVWEEEITDACVLSIPPLAKQLGVRIYVQMIKDGKIVIESHLEDLNL